MATTANMSLDLPDVSVTIGPTYATKNNTAFTTVDQHDHTTGKGVLVPTAGLNINADLEFNDNSATELVKTAFTSQGSILTGSNFVHVSSGELYFNDGSSNQVKLTNAGSINVAGSGGFGGDYISAGASAIYTDATKAYTFQDSASAQAIMIFKGLENNGKAEWNTTAITTNTTLTDTDDNLVILVDTTSAAVTLTLPDPTLGERVFVVRDSGGNSDVNNITMARNGSENINGAAASYVHARNSGSFYIISDATDWWTFSESDNPKSITVFRGPTTSNSTIPTTFASPTLSAAAFTLGTAVSRSTNDLTFPYNGTYNLGTILGAVGVASGNAAILVRLRNTTDGSTVVVSTPMRGDSDAVSTQNNQSFFTITDNTKTYQIQWVCTTGSTTTVSAATEDGESGPQWQFSFEYIGY